MGAIRRAGAQPRAITTDKQIVPSSLLAQAFSRFGRKSFLRTDALVESDRRRARREIDVEKEFDLKWQRARWVGICICRAAPPDMVVALGSNYERLFVIPSMNALIVRQGMSAKVFRRLFPADSFLADSGFDLVTDFLNDSGPILSIL